MKLHQKTSVGSFLMKISSVLQDLLKLSFNGNLYDNMEICLKMWKKKKKKKWLKETNAVISFFYRVIRLVFQINYFRE